ncbi:hypothetical protein ACQ4PT_010974 [Festuca glaucescens]
MAQETSAPPRAQEKKQYLSHDLVLQILLHLPTIGSLLRFTSVSRTWHNTITGDRSFQGHHFLLQEPGVLIRPRIRSYAAEHTPRYTTPGLYQWERKSRPDTATLVQAMDSLPEDEAWRHKLAHCDGLVLVPTNGCRVRVLNPATRRVLTLPLTESQRGGAPFEGSFGLGHDSRSGTYKVARFFYRSGGASLLTGVYPSNLGMEVFSIGRDQRWRETAVPPPYPVFAGQTATFFKGSLLWMINESLILGNRDVAVRGLLHFNLEDESFSVMPAPPRCPELWYSTSNLAEIRGELCLAHLCPPNHGTPATTQASRIVWIWACDGAIPPRWVQRHAIDAPSCIHMIAASDADNDGVVLQRGSCILECSERWGIEGVVFRKRALYYFKV